MIALAVAAAQLLAFGPAGLKVGEQVDVKAQIDGAAYDPAMDLVWYVSGGELYALDLRDAKAKPAPIAKGLPEGAFAIAGTSTAAWEVDTSPTPYPVFTIAKGKAKVSTGDAHATGADDKDIAAAKKAMKKVKVIGARWIAKLAKRKPREVAAAAAAGLPKVKVPADMASCDTDGHCGTAFGLGALKVELVVIADDCSDEGCTERCALYDPKRKAFASPTQPKGEWGAAMIVPDTCSGYAVDPGGSDYAVGTAICTVGKTVACKVDPDWTYVAWVA